MEIRFELKTHCFDFIINYYLPQKPKLIENSEFNHNYYSNNCNILRTK